MTEPIKNMQIVGEQLIPAIAYGDAAGLSVETRDRATILAKYGRVTGITPTCEHPAFADEPGGVWSDDTQGSMAVIESLVRVGGFDLQDQAQTLLRYMDETPLVQRGDKLLPRGWGGSTVNSLLRIRDGQDPLTSGEQPGDGGGAGNGVLMKLAPLVFWQEATGVDPVVRQQQITEFTQMTHAAPESLVSSLVHADVLTRLLREPEALAQDERVSLVKFALRQALFYEDLHDDQQVTSRHLDQLAFHPTYVPEEIIDSAPRGGFYAPETLVMVYGSFVLNSRFPGSVHEVIELGGDTDTTAAIIAPMSLFDAGEVHMPYDARQLDQPQRLGDVSCRLAELVMKGERHGETT